MPVAQTLRAVVMALASIATALSPDVGEFVAANAETVVALLTAAWALIAGWQAWRKRKEAKA